jgi:hypothetical protein
MAMQQGRLSVRAGPSSSILLLWILFIHDNFLMKTRFHYSSVGSLNQAIAYELPAHFSTGQAHGQMSF